MVDRLNDLEPWDPRAAKSVVESIRKEHEAYQVLKDGFEVRSFCSDQIHDDRAFLLAVVDKLLPAE